MSLLPKSKKSAEEIAKLREALGIIGQPQAEEELLAEPQKAPIVEDSPLSPLPVAETHKPKAAGLPKPSERVPGLPKPDPAGNLSPRPAGDVPAPPPAARNAKIVRSLRKSEQGPVAPVPPPSGSGKLPVHRHTEEEIQQIRRHEFLSGNHAAGHLLSLTAHPVLIVPGYLFAIAAAVGIYFYGIPKEAAAGCLVMASIIAAIIFFKKPLSVHHAAFIGVAVLFVVVFGTLHYFPHLQHGT